MELAVLNNSVERILNFIPNNRNRGNFKFTFIDMFAGIGGFHQALKELGGHCVAACEIDDCARETYLANHSVAPEYFYKDIHDLETNKLPHHDLLCAGFPCQPFSISGKQQALNDNRSNVIDPLLDIIRIKNPRMVMLENVKHIRYVNQGRAFKHIVESLEKLSYKGSYELLNAKDFGVAQNRERWVFIGVLDAKKYTFCYKKNNPVLLRDVIDELGDFIYLEEAYTLIDAPKKQLSGLIFCGYRNKKIRKKSVRSGTEHLSRVHKQPNRIYSIDGIHPTIPSQESSGRFWILLHDGKVRKLTVAECFRIMGFKDDFVKPGSDGNLYKQIGNSVCIPMVKSISESLLKHMGYSNV
jgi:DNA (cytosine-5)-methyltransferase 1